MWDGAKLGCLERRPEARSSWTGSPASAWHCWHWYASGIGSTTFPCPGKASLSFLDQKSWVLVGEGHQYASKYLGLGQGKVLPHTQKDLPTSHL